MTNNLIPHYYRVTIVPGSMIGPAPADGFIDNTLISEYGALGAYPSTLVLSRAKARANYRFKRLIELLSETQVISHVLDIVATGATADAPATSFSFTLVYDREEYVYTHNELFGFAGHATENDKLLQDVDAIKRQIARAFIEEYQTNMEFPRDPVTASLGYGWIDEQLVVGTALVGDLNVKIDAAEANITVVKVNHT